MAIRIRDILEFVVLVIASLHFLGSLANSEPPPRLICQYTGPDGRIVVTNDFRSIPAALAAKAKCTTEAASPPSSPETRQAETGSESSPHPMQPQSQPVRTLKPGAIPNEQYLASPDEINLKGNLRTEILNTPIGTVHMRWPRSAETLFGRNPMRALIDAAQTVARAVKRSPFPSRIQSLDLDWQVVFMDEKLPENQIPMQLISNCHPGWMTPPGNVYIVAQRVAAGCSERRLSLTDADKLLTQVLVHEMGHAVEYQLLPNQSGMDRMRAEGFATWFEHYASQYSAILSEREIRSQQIANARAAPPGPLAGFGGTGIDYARASMYFYAIERRGQLPALIKVYDTMNSSALEFIPAIEKALFLSPRQLEQEVAKVMQSGS